MPSDSSKQLANFTSFPHLAEQFRPGQFKSDSQLSVVKAAVARVATQGLQIDLVCKWIAAVSDFGLH